MRLWLFFAWAWVIGASVGLPPHHGKLAWITNALAIMWAVLVWWRRREIAEVIAHGFPERPCEVCRRQEEWRRAQHLDDMERWRERMARGVDGRAN